MAEEWLYVECKPKWSKPPSGTFHVRYNMYQVNLPQNSMFPKIKYHKFFHSSLLYSYLNVAVASIKGIY